MNERPHLSPRRAEVAEGLADGLSNGEIARALYVTEDTVKTHVKFVFATYGVFSRAAIVFPLRNHGYGTSPLPSLLLLTPRERELLEHAARGLNRSATARAMGVSPMTVKSLQHRIKYHAGHGRLPRLLAQFHDTLARAQADLAS